MRLTGSTKISMNFKNKTLGTSETNKSFNHYDLEWGFINCTKIMDEPRIYSQITLEFKMKRENLQLKSLIDKRE